MMSTQPYRNNICVLSNFVSHCIMNRKCCLSLNSVFDSVIFGGLSTNICLFFYQQVVIILNECNVQSNRISNVSFKPFVMF